MSAVSKNVASRSLFRSATVVAIVAPLALLAACAEPPPPPPPAPVYVAPPAPAPAPVPPARG
jgi:uncharacterized lipoprotein YajG